MSTMQTVALGAHTIVAVLVIVLVLLQRGKGADAGAAFGAGASGTVFGARGSASFFSRATAVLATLFFVTSLGLAYLSSQGAAGPESLLDAIPANRVGEDGQPQNEASGAVPAADTIPSLKPLPEPPQSDTIEDLPVVEEQPSSEEQPL